MDITGIIKTVMHARYDMRVTDLARRIGKSPQNVYDRIKANRWTIPTITETAAALDCYVVIQLRDIQTGKKIAEIDNRDEIAEGMQTSPTSPTD